MTTLISYAQNFEDVMLWRALKHVENGFYIDLGAQDPVVDSVSLAFHEHGWKGIHVEPSPHYAQLLRAQRPGDTVIEAAVGNAGDMLTFFEIPDTGISTADPHIAQQHRERGFETREITVPCVRLSSIFKACGTQDIHWMKIDVEGFEWSALTSWGKSTARPWIVVVESTLPMTQIESHEQWEPILLRRGYTPVYFDGLNRYYISKEKSELKQAFYAPPNVFDHFSVNGTASSALHRLLQVRHAAELVEVAAQIQRANSEIEGLKQTLTAREVDHGEQLLERLTQLDAKNEEVVRLEQTHHDKISSLQAEVVQTSGLLIAAKDEFSEVLNAAQQEALKSAQALAAREQEFSVQAAEREQTHRTEISSLQAEVVRTSGLLIAAKDEFAGVLDAAQQQALKSVQALATREQEFSAQVAAREQAHRTEISSLQAEVVRTSGLLIAAKDEFAGVLHAAKQESLKAAQALAVHEREVSTMFLAQEQEFRKMLSAAQTEIARFTNLLVDAKDQNAILQRSTRQELLKAEKLLLDSEQRTRDEVNHLAMRERELGAQLVARADAFSALQRETKHEQTTLLHEISTIRENADLLTRAQQQREHGLLIEVSAGNEKIIQLEHTQARIAQELGEQLAQAAKTTSQLQEMLSEARQEQATLQNTLSWRLTGPFRAIGQRLGRKRKPGISTNGENRAQSDSILSSAPESAPESNLTNADFGNTQEAHMFSADKLGNSLAKTSHAQNLAELFSLDGEQFIEGAYVTLLKRSPDSSGGKFYLDRLLNGVAKIQILDDIGSSGEAQRSGVLNLAELLSLDGKQFIECAYYALLKRLPDSSGGKFYVGQLLKGVAKVQILDEIGASEEARRLGAMLSGLQVAIRTYRRARRPLKGVFIRMLRGVEGSSASDIRLRSIEQQFFLFNQHADARLDHLSQCMTELQRVIVQQGQQSMTTAQHAVSAQHADACFDRLEQRIADLQQSIVQQVQHSVITDQHTVSATPVALDMTPLPMQEPENLNELPARTRDIYKKLSLAAARHADGIR